MEFIFSVFFLLVYYIRPQDWVSGMEGMNLVKPIIGVWLLAILAFRSRPSPIPGLFRTPHDWVMLAYYLYVGLTAPDVSGTLKGFVPLVVFYFLTVQSLNTWPRLISYLKWWNGALITIAIFGVLILFGIDITGGSEPTNFFRGRLSLGTWLHNNPNALGHSVVVVIPLSYLLFFWRRPVVSRFFAFPFFAAIAFYCAWETESKGAFLVGGMLTTLIFVVGRPKPVQIFSLMIAFTMGVSALSFLPRMTEMGNLRSDPGVQGRLLAWEMARDVTKTQDTGVGWKQFVAYVPWREGMQYMVVPKATHSSYVQVGADLGRYGLFLYLAGIWVALHTLLVVKTRDDAEERCRRAIMLLLLAYALSGWMINRQYHTEYFLVIAAAAALHRLSKARELVAATPAPEDQRTPSVEPDLDSKSTPELPDPAAIAAFSLEKVADSRRVRPLWNRLGFPDLAVCALLTWGTLWAWDYIMKNI